MTSNKLKPDGERYLPEFRGNIELEHYHRYYLAKTLAEAKDVLDIASGEGFGSNILSDAARSVVGVDISEDAIAHARLTYVKPNLTFSQGSATAIPLPDRSIDLIVSFETIEHLADHDAMMLELKRVLRPDGCMVISSPNKLVYTDRANYKNPFHVRELYTAEFVTLTSQYFRLVKHYGQRVMTASVIASDDSATNFRTFISDDQTPGVADQTYDLILASDEELPSLDASAYEGSRGARDLPTTGRNDGTASRLIAEIARLEHDNAERHAAEDRLNRQLSLYRTAIAIMQRHAQTILHDKWWRRTDVLRGLSNSLRERRGRPPKEWATSVDIDHYLQLAEERERLLDQRSASDDEAPTAIPRVPYSEITESFVPYTPEAGLETCVRTIAFYLPQFHRFEENDKWWGRGFTEWTNVAKALPFFPGHHQPHCPIHLGYYDLRLPEVMREQAKIAREHGIFGFAYYFYWFAGKVLMEQPLRQMLHDPTVDIPFCLIWANENWTRRWDGLDHEVLIAQNHSIEDSEAFLVYLREYMNDPRYIRIDGKPLLIVYRADIIPQMKETILAWRAQARAFGFPGLYLVCAQTFGHGDPRPYGFDAAMEFPPHTAGSTMMTDKIRGMDPGFAGTVYSYFQMAVQSVRRRQKQYKVFPTAMLSWDNTARKGLRGTIFHDFSVTRYAQWLSSNVEHVAKHSGLSPDERLTFVNAWNEWAEGAHLEPDRKHGFGYLVATRSVLRNYVAEASRFLRPQVPARCGSGVAVMVHLYYEDTWADLRTAIKQIDDWSPDLFVTVTSLRLSRLVEADFPNAVIELVDNRGRDIRPFLLMLRRIHRSGYRAVGKVHGKMSVYREDGVELRRAALDAVLCRASVELMLTQPSIGLLAPASSLIEHSDHDMTYDWEYATELAQELGLRRWRGRFPAGSMFWFRPEALELLLRLDADDFELESGLADGTRAHAIERLFGAVCEASGYTVVAAPA